LEKCNNLKTVVTIDVLEFLLIQSSHIFVPNETIVASVRSISQRSLGTRFY